MALALPPGLEPFFIAWSAVVGAVIGSFLNVVIARVPAGESIVHPPSHCPRCGARIAWYDNVPVAAWLWLRGRCRSCRGSISPRYPIVEALGAAAGALAAWRHGPSLAALAELALVALLLALSFIDLDTWTLPHALTWPLVALGLAASAAGASAAPSLRSSAVGAAVGFVAFAAVALVGEKLLRREAMGWGDVFLLAGLGAWLGVAALLPVVLLASIQGAAVGIALLLLGKAQPGPAPRDGGAAPADDEEWVPPRNAVPFGPFLAAAALEWLYAGGWIARLVPMLGAFR
ncbi:prepilin peptidase [Anaeromyxobacter oryzisoli]|uniref:prepilin peptidase n=1 Tax=Anaeromyxobacter oryzisoli TaxID=2925408 RepID=UPI001F5990AA|nr:A24 family peptidase [Anaeromyxobacter sp. SG63]